MLQTATLKLKPVLYNLEINCMRVELMNQPVMTKLQRNLVTESSSEWGSVNGQRGSTQQLIFLLILTWSIVKSTQVIATTVQLPKILATVVLSCRRICVDHNTDNRYWYPICEPKAWIIRSAQSECELRPSCKWLTLGWGKILHLPNLSSKQR